MIAAVHLIAALVTFLLVFFLVALWGERLAAKGKNPANNRFVYSLSLAVYASTWTFYGSIGSSVTAGPLYLAVYLGPTLGAILWWDFLRRLISLKEHFGLTSVADLLSVRYNKSQLLGGLIACCCLVGVIPYVALQLKAIRTTYYLISGLDSPVSGFDSFSLSLTILLILFVIAFGLRRLDATERHQGMVLAVTFESVFKLIAFLIVGAIIVFYMFDGFGDIARQSAQSAAASRVVADSRGGLPLFTWMSYLLLAASAFILLPRQFHLAVVENYDKKHLFTAMWLLPLYLLLINIFVYPIGRAGTILGLQEGDFFLLTIPLLSGLPLLSLLVFVGGVAAGTSMMSVSVVALAHMVTNHIYLPLVELFKVVNMRGRLLWARWMAVVLIFAGAYLFDFYIGRSQTLVFLGIMSFAAVYQFMPATLGALFWRQGTYLGAIGGIASGFGVWIYTLLIPTLAMGGFLPETIVSNGPFGIELLRPTSLFGFEGLDLISHCVFWSTLVNGGIYVFISLLIPPTKEEFLTGDIFVNILNEEKETPKERGEEAKISIAEKLPLLRNSLKSYFSDEKARLFVKECLAISKVTDRSGRITLLELSDLAGNLEKLIAGSIGTTAAHRCIEQSNLFSRQERRELGAAYGEMLAELQLTPSELSQKISYHKEREELLTSHAAELQERIDDFHIEMKQRLQAEKELRTSEELYRTLLDALPVGIVIHRYGRIRYMNSTALIQLGYHLGDLQRLEGQNLLDFIHKDDKKFVSNRIDSLRSTQEILPLVEVKYLREDASVMYAQATSVPMQFNREEVVLTILFDLTERREALEEKRLLSSAAEQAAELILIANRKGEISYVNPAFCQTTGFGVEDVVGMGIESLNNPDFDELYRNVCARASAERKEVVFQRKDGSKFEADLNISPIVTEDKVTHIVSLFHDITQSKNLERKLRQSQKMEALGTMAGGIAHDFNNLLFIILGNVELVTMETTNDSSVQKKLEDIKQAGDRATDLVKKILSFAKYGDINRYPVALSPVVDEVVKMMKASLPQTIEVSFTDYLLKDLYVLADPTELHQILMNLCANAGQAMARKGGRLEVTLSCLEIDNMSVDLHPDLAVGKNAHITVRDNGRGIPAEYLERIFEPFYTTKALGQGTGLGLAVVHTLVSALGGEITVDSIEGRGTIFDVYLPMEQTPAEKVDEAIPAEVHEGGKHILVVDDEEAIIELLSTIFKSLNYQYTGFTSSTQAYEDFINNPDRYDLIFTDQTMPDLIGTELAKKILMIRPEIPIILCSGYSQLVTPQLAKEMGIQAFLTKPILFHDVSRVLADIFGVEKVH